MKATLRRVLRGRAVRTLLRGVERIDTRSRSTLRVLTYHTITDALGFAEQVEHLVRHYQPVRGTDVVQAMNGEGELPPRAVLVTFDDADRSFAEVAWPLLKQAGVPVLLFVPTAYPDCAGNRFWWEDLTHAVLASEAKAVSDQGRTYPLGNESERRAAIRALKVHAHSHRPAEVRGWVAGLLEQLSVGPPPTTVVGWSTLRQLAAEGVEIGGHTRTHPFLDRLEGEALRGEIAGGLDDLEEKLGTRPQTFAYPYGRHDDAVVEAVRAASLSVAFTTVRGPNDLRRADPFRLRRINIGPAVGAGVLQARLLQSSPRFGRHAAVPNQDTGPVLSP